MIVVIAELVFCVIMILFTVVFYIIFNKRINTIVSPIQERLENSEVESTFIEVMKHFKLVNKL